MRDVRRTPDRARRIGVVIALLVVGLVPAAPALATTDAPAGAGTPKVTFNGAGWGHGVGLSQYGAYGAARDGWSAEKILSHFFKGTSIATLGTEVDAAPPLWVNLEKDRSEITLIAREIGYVDPPGPPVPVVVTRGTGADAETWEMAKDDRLEITWNKTAGTCSLDITDANGETVVTPGAGKCEVDITWDGWVEQPTRKIEIAGCTNTNWNTNPTTFPACQYGRGDLHLRAGPGGMDLSVELKLDDYVLGISEMPYRWGLASNGGFEALKAQAIAARSYARELQIYRGEVGHNSCGAWCDVRDTTFDQRYVGWGHGGDGQTEWIAAAKETAGQVVTHPDAPSGTIVRTYYSSSSGGATENGNEVFGSFSNPIEYYTSVDDHWSLDPGLNGNASWTREFTADYVADRVGLDSLVSVEVTERNTSTSARTVRFVGLVDGLTVTVEKKSSSVKSLFGLKSIYFDVSFGEPVPFSDIKDSIHYDDIVYVKDAGITRGCNPPANTNYCPDGDVTRGEMAAFIVRALSLTDTGGRDWFGDDNGSVFENDINRLAAAGITTGCNDAGTDFCPDQEITRGEMAAFLVRGFGYTDSGEGNYFTDDDGSRFEGDINRLRAAGVTFGCNPPDNTKFCPDDPVARGQMASFLARALIAPGA